MSQAERDPLLDLIDELTANMGGIVSDFEAPGATTHDVVQSSGSSAVAQCIPETLTHEGDETRQGELQGMREIGICRGVVFMDSIRQGDEVVLDLGTNPIESEAASTRIHAVGEGTIDHPDESKGAPGMVLIIKDEERTNPGAFCSDPIPAGSRIVLYGTALPSNDYMRPNDRGRIVRGQTPVIAIEDQRMRQATTSSRHSDGRQLEINQVTVDGVPMFADKE